MTIDPDELSLAGSMLKVHGGEAPAVARGNARNAALSGQPMQVRSWIRVLGIIQHRRADTPCPLRRRVVRQPRRCLAASPFRHLADAHGAERL
jgi:hypothetical protein